MRHYKVKKELTIITNEGKELTLQPGSVFKSADSIKIVGIEEVLAEPIYETYNPWWFADYGILDIWKMGYTGKGVKVAVLDSGIYLEDGSLHKDLDIIVENLFDATKYSAGMRDFSGHGVHISGIIKASNNGFGITGIVYNCDFYFAKISSDYDGNKCEYLIKGINWAIERKVDLINISHGYRNSSKDFKENEKSLKSCIAKAVSQNIVVVSASGNGSEMLYPAGYAEVISVGSVKIDKTLNNFVPNTNIHAPGDEIYSTFIDPIYKKDSGSSQACAFVTGVIALMINKYKSINKVYTPCEIKNSLIKNATIHNSARIINPTQVINSI